jgi:hypothetical protein
MGISANVKHLPTRRIGCKTIYLSNYIRRWPVGHNQRYDGRDYGSNVTALVNSIANAMNFADPPYFLHLSPKLHT